MVPGADAAAGTPVRVSDDLVELLTVTQRRLARGVAAVLAEDGATLDGYRLLRSLAGAGGRSMGELVAALHLPAAHADPPRRRRGRCGPGLPAARSGGRPEGRRPPVRAGPYPAVAAGGAGERPRGGAGCLARRGPGRGARAGPRRPRLPRGLTPDGARRVARVAFAGTSGGLTTRARARRPFSPDASGRAHDVTAIGLGLCRPRGARPGPPGRLAKAAVQVDTAVRTTVRGRMFAGRSSWSCV